MPILRSVVPALLVACAIGTSVGCSSSSSDSGSPTPDGGVPTSEGGPGTDGGGGPGTDGGDGGPAACTVNATDAIANEPKQLSNLEVTATSVVFLSVPAGAAPPASIEKMNLDGSGRTTLYTSAGDRRIHSMKVQGDTAYFFETDNAAAVPVDELWSIPLAGGTPTQVGTVSFDSGPRFVGSDASNLYVSYTTAMPAGDHFDRVVLASSTVESIAFLPDRGTVNMASITGNDVFFWSGKTGADATIMDIFHFDKTATAATPTALPGGLSALCDISTAGMYATPTKVACGFSGLNAYNHDGTGVQALIAKDLLHLGPNVLVGADAETLYVLDRGRSTTGTGTIVKIASTGGAVTPVACDVKNVENRLLNAFFPVQTEYEVTIGATDAYWIEKRGTTTNTWFVRHARK